MQTIRKYSFQMKSKSIFLRQETGGNFHMRLRVICKKAVLLYKTKILRFFPSFLTITFFCHVSHLFIEIPEGIMRIAFVLFEGSCFSTSLLVRMPTLGKPSVFRIQFLQHHGLIYIIRFRQSVLHGFLQKQCKVYCRTVCNIKMSAPSITKKRDATPGIHQAKRQCRIYAIGQTCLVLFILALALKTSIDLSILSYTFLPFGQEVSLAQRARSIPIFPYIYCLYSIRTVIMSF